MAVKQKRTPLSLYVRPRARGTKGQELKPDGYIEGYYGSSGLSMKELQKVGLGGRGPNLSIEDHVLAQGGTAYRGTTPYVVSPDKESGAALWAGKGGIVVHVDGVPGWDANRHLGDGQLQRSGVTLRDQAAHLHGVLEPLQDQAARRAE